MRTNQCCRTSWCACFHKPILFYSAVMSSKLFLRLETCWVNDTVAFWLGKINVICKFDSVMLANPSDFIWANSYRIEKNSFWEDLSWKKWKHKISWDYPFEVQPGNKVGEILAQWGKTGKEEKIGNFITSRYGAWNVVGRCVSGWNIFRKCSQHCTALAAHSSVNRIQLTKFLNVQKGTVSLD
jgi:hypothetical protein